jgi:putative membrane protein
LNAPIKPEAAESAGTPPVAAETPASKPAGDFGSVIGKLFRALKYVSWGMILVSGIVLFREVKTLADGAFAIHPVLGWAFLVLVGVLFWIGAVRPIRRYWAIPAAVRPPRSGRLADADAAAIARRARFLTRVADNLARNPRLVAIVPEIVLARIEAEGLEAAARSGTVAIDVLKRDLRSLETVRFDSLFKPLDVEANHVIRAEALAVGLGTAVSMSGTFDAWLVMWRNLTLVSKLATIYYGRPGIRGTFFVIRDVATAMLLAAKMQGALEGTANFLASWFGSAGSAIIGPVADGAMNALVTVRIGYVAKARCRSFRVWNDATLGDILVRCFKEAASHGKGVVLDVFKGARGGLRRVTTEVWQRTTGLVARFFSRPQAEPTPAD